MKKINTLLSSLLILNITGHVMASDYSFKVENLTNSKISFIAMQRKQADHGHGSANQAHNCMRTVKNHRRWDEKTVSPRQIITVKIRVDDALNCTFAGNRQWYWFKTMGQKRCAF